MKTKKRLGAGRGEGKGNDGIVLTIKGASFLMISHLSLLWEMSKKKNQSIVSAFRVATNDNNYYYYYIIQTIYREYVQCHRTEYSLRHSLNSLGGKSPMRPCLALISVPMHAGSVCTFPNDGGPKRRTQHARRHIDWKSKDGKCEMQGRRSWGFFSIWRSNTRKRLLGTWEFFEFYVVEILGKGTHVQIDKRKAKQNGEGFIAAERDLGNWIFFLSREFVRLSHMI